MVRVGLTLKTAGGIAEFSVSMQKKKIKLKNISIRRRKKNSPFLNMTKLPLLSFLSGKGANGLTTALLLVVLTPEQVKKI